jgi:hypothetical protein
MEHEHFWRKSSKKQVEDLQGVLRRVVAECDCGENLFEVSESGHEHFWEDPESAISGVIAQCACGETLHKE